MDYDENDFQNQNHHIAGENNKFLPVLNPYPLPKFEFEDSLQGHLRFDSLVESEVFLGIESNEDNKWIEDFSRGNCGIDFSKSAAGPCSIHPCNNVWSEAASSESVEMLLKSVGQEEAIPRKTVAKVSDAFDDLGCSTKRMEPNVCHEAMFSEIHEPGGLQTSVSPTNSSRLENDTITNQSQNEVRLQSNHGESLENDVTNLDVERDEKLELLAGGFLRDGETCYDDSGRDVSNMGDDSVENDIEGGMTRSVVKADDIAMYGNNLIIEDALKSQGDPHPGNDASLNEENSLQQDNSLLGGELITSENKNELNNENDGDKKPNMDSDGLNKQKSDITLVESMNSHLEGATHLCSNEESTREKNTGGIVDDIDQACTYKDVPVNDASTSDQLSQTAHMDLPVLLETNIELDGHQVEEVVSSQQDDDSCLQKDHVEEKYKPADDQLIAGGLESKSVPSSCTMEEKVSKNEDERGMMFHPVNMQADSRVADTMGSPKIVVSMVKSTVQDQDLSPAQDRTTETEEVDSQVDAINPESVSDYQDDITVFLPGLRNENGNICIPAVTDNDVLVSSVGKSGNDENAIDDHKNVDKLAEAVLHPAQLEVEDDAELESCKRDLRTQLSDSHVAVEERAYSEPVQDLVVAQQSFNEQCMHMTISESTVALENCSPRGPCEFKTAGARVSLECDNALEVAENLVDVTQKIENCDEATITPEKSGVSTAQEKCETEPSGDVSKAVDGSSVLIGSLPASHQVLDVTKDGIDHCDTYQRNSGTQIVSGNGSLSASEKEIVKSEILIVQYVEVPGTEAQDGKNAPHVLRSNEINVSKSEKSSTFQFVEASASASGPIQARSETQHIVNQVKLQMDSKENRSSKGTSDCKSRTSSFMSARRESAKKGNLGKDAHSVKKAEQPGKSSDVPLVPSGIYQLLQPNDMFHNRQMEEHGICPIGVPSTPPSSLPDLNSSAFPSMVFQQPFNDTQQVQLRAQILVYGSLISRLLPDELHMLSAFGGSDGGRSLWEKAWQTCKARVSDQAPGLISSDTATPSQSAGMVSDPRSKQIKVTPSPVEHSSTIGTPTVGTNPMIPLSSPLWNLPTPSLDVLQSKGIPPVMDCQSVFPQLGPNQIQPVISYCGHSNTWMPQTSLHGPWVASPQTSAVNTSIRFPSFSMESVQHTLVREPSLVLCSAMKQTLPGPSAHSGVYTGAITAASPSLDLAKVIVQSGQPSSDPKLKKSKKGPPSEDQNRSTMESQSHSEKPSVPASVSSFTASATAATTDCFLPKCTTREFDAFASPAPSISPVKKAEPVNKKIVLSEEVNEVQKVRQQVDNATAAVSRSQEVWLNLDKKRISGSISALEAKISFATVAISSAVAVAKAAAMAANLASNSALQEKALVGEALTDGSCSNSRTMDDSLRGVWGRNTSSSIILAAKEASRRRIEAASAAALRAENLDIIVQAAELAAKAIIQAGNFVTIGDPSSLSRLAEAGPEGFWELPLSSLDLASNLQDASTEQECNENVRACSNGSMKNLERLPDNEMASFNQNAPSLAPKDILTNPIEDQVTLIVGISGTSADDKDQSGEKLPTTYDPASKISECQYGLRSQNIVELGESKNVAGVKGDNGIHEGTRVEVFKDGAWFSADVMSLVNGKAYVHHTELLSAGGTGKLQEWVEIEGLEDKAPKIRIPHPMSAVQLAGSRKRQRAAIGSFTCSVGDKVDAWIQNRWWEGVVTGKSETDVTSITVHLPAIGETSVVKIWQLRPALIWKDGEWIVWSSREDDHTHQMGETPKGKRAKLGSSGKQENDKAAKTVKVPDYGKLEGSKLLHLSANEKVFDIGKSGTDEGKPGARRIIRSGLRNQGHGVIFGVPKPGKKRRFMEVSKHYVADQCNKKARVNNSVKNPNYMMPRGTRPHGLRNAPRCDVKEEKASELKMKASAEVKSRGLSGRVAAKKGSKHLASALGDAAVTDRNGKIKDTSGHVVKHNLVGNGLFATSEVAIGAAVSFSSGVPSDATVSEISAPISDSLCKVKPALTGGKLGKLEEDKALNSISLLEPRRSNRKIQPTSRLLEGLQTSSFNLKVPPSLLDKCNRSAHDCAKGKI